MKLMEGTNLPVVVVDLDNVIAETDKLIRSIIKRRYNIGASQEDITEFDYHKCISITEKQEKEVLDEFHNRHIAEPELVPNSKEILCLISKHYKTFVATQRPRRTRKQTLHWLEVHEVPYHELHVVKKKEQLLKFQPRWIIDDRWENAIELIENNVGVIIYDRPWNRNKSHESIIRAHNWRDILSILSIH